MEDAPGFSLQNQDGKLISLADFSGKWLVIYFYPKDNTSGCTKEACSFRDEREVIAETGGAEIVGVSTDSVNSHKKFAEKNNLNFNLLSDHDHAVINAYGSWKPLKFMGHEYIGTQRNTFIVNPDGKIVKEYIGVDPKAHAAEIIKDLKKLQDDAR